MQSAYSIDLKLLNKFQKVTEWVQQFSGYDNFMAARVLRILMICCFLVREVIAFMQGMDIAELIIIACSITVISKMFFMQRTAEDALRNNNKLMNPTIVDFALTRIIIQFVAIGGFGFLVNHIYNIINFKIGIVVTANEVKDLCWDMFAILLFLVVYFNSCTPKPFDMIKKRKPLNHKKWVASR